MYYEIYVDVLFLVNFMMDYILLLVVKKMKSCNTSHGRICLGAFLGAFLTILIIVLPIPYAAIKFILFHTVVNTCMILIGLKIKDLRLFLHAMILLYIGSFLLGGILGVFQQYVKIGSLFFAVAVGGYYMVLGIWKFILLLQKRNLYYCEVDLFLGQNSSRMKALIDTGNGLRSPVDGRPVSILDKKAAKAFMGELSVKDIRYIPYYSIGKKQGVLLAVQIDKMCVYQDTEVWIEKQLIAISEEAISASREYEIILNPNLF